MTDLNEFTTGRDEELGSLLRAHLSAPDDAAFAARMRIEAIAAAEDTAWRSVARGTLPGLAAAAVVLAVLGAALGGGSPQPATRSASGSAAGSLVELASDTSPAGSVALLAVMAY
ncbi:MAG: hypothetical protein OEV95_12285 [Gemmatimonadota bacterium]|jgi:hypothetical protein|nr:hypothetical protein [Gemmatimonadota bacterium]